MDGQQCVNFTRRIEVEGGSRRPFERVPAVRRSAIVDGRQ
jgi:hypothetical protein